MFDKIASVYSIRKIYLHFRIGNGQPRKPALCQLYRHAFVSHTDCRVKIIRVSRRVSRNNYHSRHAYTGQSYEQSTTGIDTHSAAKAPIHTPCIHRATFDLTLRHKRETLTMQRRSSMDHSTDTAHCWAGARATDTHRAKWRHIVYT